MIRGRVVDGSGIPIQGARVYLASEPSAPGERALTTTTTSDDGAFVLAAPAEGLYSIIASRTPEWTSQGVRIIVPMTSEVSIVLQRALTIAGWVKSERGLAGSEMVLAEELTPDAGDVRVTGRSAGTRIRRDGSFLIKSLWPGRYRVSVARAQEGGNLVSVGNGVVVVAGAQDLELKVT